MKDNKTVETGPDNIPEPMEIEKEIDKVDTGQKVCNDEDTKSSEPTPSKVQPKKKITWNLDPKINDPNCSIQKHCKKVKNNIENDVYLL